jgi:hypothetical protein
VTPETEFELGAVVLSKIAKQHVVWATQGQGGIPLAEFDTLEEALSYTERNKGEMSFGIMQPSGEWHKWTR